MVTGFESQIASFQTALLIYGQIAVSLILLFILGYIIGYVICNVLRRILSIGEITKNITLYSAMPASLWSSIVNFVSLYVKWLIVVFVINAGLINPTVEGLFAFMTNLLWFIVLAVVGLIIGGLFYKFVRDGLHAIGFEEGLKRRKADRALGDVPVTSVLASTVKWYIVLLFLTEGAAKLGLPVLSRFMQDLMAYIPSVIFGGVVLLVTLIIADFVGNRAKQVKVGFAEELALGAEIVIIFLGVVLVLPKFGIMQIDILVDSFKIVVAGASIGIAIAFGLGLKESIAAAAKKRA